MKMFQNRKEMRQWLTLCDPAERKALSEMLGTTPGSWKAESQVIMYQCNEDGVWWRLVAKEVVWERVPDRRRSHE